MMTLTPIAGERPRIRPRPKAPEAAAAAFDLRPSSRIECRIIDIGQEGHKAIVLDGLLSQPGAIRDFAIRHGLFLTEGKSRSDYPGVRAEAPAAYATVLMQAVEPVARPLYGIGNHIHLAPHCLISLIATDAAHLRASQQVPHYDMPGFGVVAAVHYLFDGNFGGTSFYRHRQTGFESITPEREPAYAKAIAEEGARVPRPGGYPCGDDQIYELMLTVPARYNRVVLFPGHLLHSAAIRPGDPLAVDCSRGRLTVTSFIALQKR